MDMGVATHHDDYDEMSPEWKKCRDVFGGTRLMREATTEYLPKLTDEDDAAYRARVNRTVLYNATYRTISGMVGMLFRVPAVLTSDESIVTMAKDISLTGVSLDVLAKNVATECLSVGRTALYVNFPEVAAGTTMADAARANIRPSITQILAEQIINWRQGYINNKYQLTMVVIEEDIDAIGKSEFDTTEVCQYRVLDMVLSPITLSYIYRVRIFQRIEDADVQIGGDYYPMRNGEYLSSIPLFIFGPDNIDPEVDTPMMIDIVDANIAHYAAYSDLANGCHWSGIPTMAITGHTLGPNEKLKVGAGAALVIPAPTAKVQMIEVGTAGFSALDSQLNRLEAHMVTLGSRMLESHKVQAESAQTALIYRAGEQSVLSALGINISTGITMALQVFAQWAGSTGAVNYTLNKEFFATPVTADILNALVSAWQAGGISARSQFNYLQRSEFYPPEMTYETEQENIVEGKPVLT